MLGTFADYLERKKTFSVPIYAVWGNHEDLMVVKNLKKNRNVKNLFLLDDQNVYEIDSGLILYGIGGNWIPGKKLFDRPLAGTKGKIWVTLEEFGKLYNKVSTHNSGSIFVSHVSPGKEPLLVRLMSHFGPDLWVSGHMGAPYSCLWNPFAVRNEKEQALWLSQNLFELSGIQECLSEEAKIAYDLLQKPLPSLENWYKKQWYLNLTDASDGYAVLNIDKGRFALQTYSRGIHY